MKTVNNPGAKLKFLHNGREYTLPGGLSDWPDDLAKHAQRKHVSKGVRVVRGANPQDQVTTTVIREVPPPVVEEAAPAPAVVPKPKAPKKSKTSPAVEPEVSTTPEVVPEVPAAPIEGEKKATVRRARKPKAPKE